MAKCNPSGLLFGPIRFSYFFWVDFEFYEFRFMVVGRGVYVARRARAKKKTKIVGSRRNLEKFSDESKIRV